MYEGFSADYDRFVDWDERLAVELPLIERQLQAFDALRVLDAACGTGMHALALAKRGYEAVGTDASEGMIDRARENAAAAGRTDVRFEVARFGELSESLELSPVPHGEGQRSASRFDAVLCLGNSLPHVLTPPDLSATLADFATCLRPQGLLLIQNRNFNAVLADYDRWMGPQSYHDGKTDWLFIRFYDFDPDGLLTFNVLRLRRREGGDWEQEIGSTRLWPLTEEELVPAVRTAGFDDVTRYGNMGGDRFDAANSPNLVIAARAPR